MALGMRFRDGIVLAADQELSAEGSHKFQEEKIFVTDEFYWAVLMAYADTPALAKEAKERIISKLIELKEQADNRPETHITNQTIHDVAESVLMVEMGQRQWNPLNLQMLIVGSVPFLLPEMWVYRDQALYRADDFTTLALGDLSLIQYLRAMYSPNDYLKTGKRLAVYLMAKATKHIHRVGEPIDIISITDGGWERLNAEEVQQIRTEIENKERGALRSLILDF